MRACGEYLLLLTGDRRRHVAPSRRPTFEIPDNDGCVFGTGHNELATGCHCNVDDLGFVPHWKVKLSRDGVSCSILLFADFKDTDGVAICQSSDKSSVNNSNEQML